MSLTNETTNAILKFFFDARIYSYRNNSMGVPIPGTGRFRSAPKTGLPDIVAIIPPHGKFCGVEVKTGRDRLRPEQFGTLENIKRMGGIAIVVTGFTYEEMFENFLTQWNEINLQNK